MSQDWAVIISLALVAAVAITWQVGMWLRFKPIARRSCRGREWRRRFPHASKAAIRDFLLLFNEEFALAGKLVLKFRPDDRVMDVYRAVYPPYWPCGDQLELESFALLLRKRYGLDLEAIWRDDLTLGEIFGQAIPPPPASPTAAR